MQDTLAQPLAQRLATLAATDAALSRLCFDRRLDTLLRPRQPGWRSVAHKIPVADTLPGYGLVWASPLAELTVTVPEGLEMAATAVVNAPGWPEPVRLACLDLIIRDSIGPIAEWAQDMGLRLTSVLNGAALAARAIGASALQWRSGMHTVGLQLHSKNASWLEQALARLRAEPPRLAEVASVSVSTALAFGWRRIGVAVLRTLAVGDVLLAGRARSVHAIEHAYLVFGRARQQTLGRACRVEQRNITLLGEHWMNEQAITETALAQPGAADPLARMEVDLHMELQVLSMPMGELANMRPGYVLELPIAAADATVELVVGGQVFGRAQLVCVGDRLGARILELNHDAG